MWRHLMARNEIFVSGTWTFLVLLVSTGAVFRLLIFSCKAPLGQDQDANRSLLLLLVAQLLSAQTAPSIFEFVSKMTETNGGTMERPPKFCLDPHPSSLAYLFWNACRSCCSNSRPVRPERDENDENMQLFFVDIRCVVSSTGAPHRKHFFIFAPSRVTDIESLSWKLLEPAVWRSREALGKLKVFSQVRFVGYPVLEHTHRAKMKTIPLPCSSFVALRECVQWPSKQSPTTKLESLSRVSVPRQMVQSFTLRYSFSLKIEKKGKI